MTKPDYDPIMYRYAGIMLLAVPDGVEIERLDGFLTVGRTEYWTGIEWLPFPIAMDGMAVSSVTGIPFRQLRKTNAPQYVDHNIRMLNSRCEALETRVKALEEQT